MDRPCNSKSQKLGLFSNLNESTYRKCKSKLEYPPIINSNDLHPGPDLLPNKKNLGLSNQNLLARKQLRFQCHYEERKKRAELRRKKIIQKLKKVYDIDVEGLNEYITRDIIQKAEIIEREKKERKKIKMEKSVVVLTKLLEEQKYKNRAKKICHPPRRKSVRKPVRAEKEEEKLESKICFSEKWKERESLYEEATRKTESVTETTVNPESTDSTQLAEGESIEEEKLVDVPKCIEPEKAEYIPNLYVPEKLRSKPKLRIERCLESSPRKVIFQDYKRNKVYIQVVKITNISCDTIHCRYLGIAVHTKTGDRFPIGVAVRDSVKLRPGLSCSTKIRLCSQDDTNRLECSIVYETRRPRAPSQYYWFIVPVSCIPAQALVKVSPLKITFPTLSWCEATGSEGTKRLFKILKVENFGGKACFCKISDTNLTSETDEESLGEGEREGEYPNYRLDALNNIKSGSNGSRSENGSEEIHGESTLLGEVEEMAKSLVHKFSDNVFTTFRFSEKFHIEIPPYSTVYIQVRFIPQYKGFHQETYYLRFEGCDNCKEQAIELIGDVKKLPLRAEPQVMDFKTCIANSGVYCGTLKVFNDSKAPHWVVVKVPSSIKNHAHVYPTKTVILPYSFSVFSVKIYPRVTLAKDAPRYYNEETQILEFPVFIHPANIDSCWREYIKIYVLALITDYSLQLSPSVVNFGTVSTLETIKTEIKLTNHSLAAQEYGFLNLKRGVRVEPNMGFGIILPRESITLYLLYSPEEDFLECEENQKYDEFPVVVTSIAKYGGFREKLEHYEDSLKSADRLFWGEDQGMDLSTGETNPPLDVQELGEFDETDECEENSSVEGEELCLKLYQQENKIREFLNQDPDEMSDISFPQKIPSQGAQSQKPSVTQFLEENTPGEFEEIHTPRGICNLKKDFHIVNCHAIVVKPRCRLSETIIQLPATPCSSFTLYRFRLNCTGDDDDEDCICGYKKISKKAEDGSKSRIAFEFQYECPHIKLEPESGFIKPGESIPINIIYRPVVSLGQESGTKEEKPVRDLASRSNSGVKSRLKQNKISDNAIEKVISTASQRLKSSDYFMGEKALEKLYEPFVEKTSVCCVVKTIQESDLSENTEVHEMVLICPVINPKFIYLGNSQEIKFDKVFIGTRSKIILQIQNVSFERISPSATLLNPVGPFICPAGVRNVELDPEHIWRQPLIYAPLAEKGIEKQFFEIYCGSTNIFLTVSGQGIQPDWRITPDFACCLIESKPGGKEELKLEVENLSAVTLNLSMRTKFLKTFPEFENAENLENAGNVVEDDIKPKREKTAQKDDVKDKKKLKKLSNSSQKVWDEIPEKVLSALENSDDVEAYEGPKIFTVMGHNENDEIVIPPSGRQQIKILFNPPPGKDEGLYAIQYRLMLGKTFLMKEMLVIGKIFIGK